MTPSIYKSLSDDEKDMLAQDIALFRPVTIMNRHSDERLLIATVVYGFYDCPQVWTL